MVIIYRSNWEPKTRILSLNNLYKDRTGRRIDTLINSKSTGLVIISVAAAIFSLFILFRPLNHDETYYLISSGSYLLEGKIPYRDFVFHQPPVILFAYMPVVFFAEYSVIAGRVVSGLYFLAAAAISWNIAKQNGHLRNIFVFFVLLLANMFLINWAVTVKIYSLSILLITAGVFYFNKFLNNADDFRSLFFTAAAFSLLLFTKIIFVFNFILLVIYTAFVLKSRFGSKKTVLYTASMCLIPIFILILLLCLFKPDPDNLFFDLFRINTMYLTFTRFTEDITGFFLFFLYPQNLIIFALAAYSLRKASSLRIFIVLNILVFILASLFTRMLAEYLVSFLPLLIMLAYWGYLQLSEDLKKNKKKHAKAISAIALIFYVLMAPLSIDHFKHFLQSRRLSMNPVQLIEFTGEINKLQGNSVVASWEGLTAFTDKKTLFKENYAVSYVNDVVNDETKKRFNLITKSDYRFLISEKIPDLVVFDNSNGAHLSESLDIILDRYKVIYESNNVLILDRKP